MAPLNGWRHRRGVFRPAPGADGEADRRGRAAGAVNVPRPRNRIGHYPGFT
jgi:hypothetical protein